MAHILRENFTYLTYCNDINLTLAHPLLGTSSSKYVPPKLSNVNPQSKFSIIFREVFHLSGLNGKSKKQKRYFNDLESYYLVNILNRFDFVSF